jgi:hypothetical protein
MAELCLLGFNHLWAAIDALENARWSLMTRRIAQEDTHTVSRII